MSINIHTPSTPRHLKITPTMVDDFVIDPVMGAYVIMGIKLDVFQAVRLRLMWWCPDMIDSSGFGTGKSLVVFLFICLRAVIVGDQHLVVYYQTFEAMKSIFWLYFQQFNRRRAPIFDAQLGKLDVDGDADGKDNTKGPACYRQYFKNESIIFGPAPNWMQDAKGQAGLTFNVAAVDEWTKVETMTKKTGRGITNEAGHAVGGINQQILGRVRRASWNQHHPIWGNHRLFLATAETMAHPGYQRYKTFESEIAKGNPNYCVFTSCFKDFSNIRTHKDIRIDTVNGERQLLFTPGRPFKEAVPDWKTIGTLKIQLTRSHFKREALGLWGRDTTGLYSEAMMQRCIAAGVNQNVQPECVRSGGVDERFYFGGIDPAHAQNVKADDVGFVTLRARPKPGLGRPPTSNKADWLAEFVWAYRIRGEKNRRLDDGTFIADRAREKSGIIHRKHLHFNFTGLLMDPQGGGLDIWPELNKSRQIIDLNEREVVPIATMDDGSVGNAHRILMLFRREHLEHLWPILPPGVESLYDAAHRAMEEAFEHGELAFPLPFNERPRAETEQWSVEQQWALKNLDTVRTQFMDMQVVTKEDGVTADLTRNGSRRFVASGKKDLAYAAMMAYVRFLIWLKMGEAEFGSGAASDIGYYSAPA